MMTQVVPEPDPDAPSAEEAAQAAELSRRERAAADAKSRDLELTNLMLRAGLDPESADSPVNKLFFEGYKGELTNDAVIEAAKGYGLIKEPDQPTGDVTDPAEREQTGQRQQVSTGTAPDGNLPSEDPRVGSIKVGEAVMERGGTQEMAIGAAFDHIAAAGYGSVAEGRKPDTRAQFIPGADDPRMQDLGW